MTETERTLLMAMADSTPTATPSNDTESCLFHPTVTLYDWWLIKAKNDFKGKRLAVAGVSSRKDVAMRVFVSAPIIKRYDEFSLETVDGKCVIISGLINEQRTIENGFGPEVFNQFIFGFPPDWESYALDFSREESTIDTNLSSGGGKKRSARLHDIKVCHLKKQAASGGISKQPDNEENSTSVAFENCDVEGLGSPATPVQSQSSSEYSVEKIVKKSASRVSRTLSPMTEGCYKKKVGRPKGSWNQSASAVKSSRLKDQSNLTEGSQPKISTVTPESSNFRTSDNEVPQFQNIELSPDNEDNSTSVALENCDVEGLGSPAIPVQSQSRSEYSVEKIVKKSASRVSRTLSPMTEGCFKKKVARPKGSRNQSASAVKKSRLKDQSNMTEGSQPKISTVTPESSNFRTSRSGRMLLPPLEFWRNQIPIYDADHELKEIKDGASLIAPCRVYSPSLSSCVVK
ncbi:kinetochore-associated protein KNL-2 homolog isoform X2 [Phaseolus vulgaris]|uniref:kinetochore-associated protein KNL-2 homolog isoform X2 n=1 Tax=Phaseolus vulgaris TaxID=3885 RepID=UPI0035CB1625